LLAFRYTNILLRWFTRGCHLARGVELSLLCRLRLWVIYGVVRSRDRVERAMVGRAVFGVAAAISATAYQCGVDARSRISIKTANLPASWSGRTAALISDLILARQEHEICSRMTATSIG